MENLWKQWSQPMWAQTCAWDSLIKNPGGGLAPIGGYIVGKQEYVDNAAFRLTAPGLEGNWAPASM